MSSTISVAQFPSSPHVIKSYPPDHRGFEEKVDFLTGSPPEASGLKPTGFPAEKRIPGHVLPVQGESFRNITCKS